MSRSAGGFKSAESLELQSETGRPEVRDRVEKETKRAPTADLDTVEALYFVAPT